MTLRPRNRTSRLSAKCREERSLRKPRPLGNLRHGGLFRTRARCRVPGPPARAVRVRLAPIDSCPNRTLMAATAITRR